MGNRRVLIVDEYTMSLAVLSIAFRLRGYTCKTIKDAGAAVAAIETFEPTAVVLEWFFRDRSGVGLSTRLRARSLEFGRPLVIVVVSVENEPEGFRDSESVDEYLIKPVPVEIVQQAIERHARPKQEA